MALHPAPGRLTAPLAEEQVDGGGTGAAPAAGAGPGRAPTVAALVAAAVLGALLAAVAVVVWGPGDDGGLGEPAVASRRGSPPADWGLAPYEDLGAWVDIFDFLPEDEAGEGPPAIGPEDLAALRGFGVRTLFLQAAAGQSLDVVDPELVGRFLRTAHELDLAVVAWYLPFLSEPQSDLARMRAIAEFSVPASAGGDDDDEPHRFDGLAVDIEWAQGVVDPAERSRRLVELSRQLDELSDGGVIGAITPPPAQLEDVNPAFWPGFPWAELGRHYDVFLPMAYWTERLAPWDDPYLLTSHSISRVRALVGDAELPVHPIGGVADTAPEGDYPAFLEAAADGGALGWSVYDYRSITVGGMARLAAGPTTTKTAPTTEPPPTTSTTRATSTTARASTSSTTALPTTTPTMTPPPTGATPPPSAPSSAPA